MDLHTDIEEEKGKTELDFWEELSCGVYSITITPSKMGGYLIGVVKKHGWTDVGLKELITWERTGIEPKPENLSGCFNQRPLIQHDVLSEFSSVSGQYQEMRWLKPLSLLIFTFQN